MKKTVSDLIDTLSKHQPSLFLKETAVQLEINRLMKAEPVARSFKKLDEPIKWYQAKAMVQGLINKQRLEKDYERIRNQNLDIWETLIYEQKTLIARLEGQEVRQQLPSFHFKDKVMYIPFFDERLNYYYTNEMPIFDINQYFKIYKEYDKYLIPLNSYGGRLYSELMCGCLCLAEQGHNYVLWDARNQVMTVCLDSKFHSFKLMMVSGLFSLDLKELANAILEHEFDVCTTFLVSHKLINSKMLKVLKKGGFINVTE